MDRFAPETMKMPAATGRIQYKAPPRKRPLRTLGGGGALWA